MQGLAEEKRAWAATAPENDLGVAVDLGTTTVAAFLWDLDAPRRLATTSATNPQTRYGVDVMSRIRYATRVSGGLRRLNQAILHLLDEIVAHLAARAGRPARSVKRLVMVGNTCMHHLFLNLDPSSLGRAPYRPVATDTVRARARDLGLTFNPDAEVIFLPLVGGFVGADTVAAAMASDLDVRAGSHLLLDLGTNGEVVVVAGGRFLVCSAAAGPAFEGGGVSAGMRAVPGAVSRVWEGVPGATVELEVPLTVEPHGGRESEPVCNAEVPGTGVEPGAGWSPETSGGGETPDRERNGMAGNLENGDSDGQGDGGQSHNPWEGKTSRLADGGLVFEVLSALRPRGFCGSGLVDLLARLLDRGIIETSGRIRDSREVLRPQRIRTTAAGNAYLAVSGQLTVTGRDIMLTQKDVRALQTAKAAIASGVRILLGMVEEKGEDATPHVVHLAGAFGNYLDPRSAWRIGLLPVIPRVGISLVGNAAGWGAQMVLVNPELLSRAEAIAQRAFHVELGGNPLFEEYFLKDLNFGEQET